MSNKNRVVVAGLGEIGKPLLQLISERYDAIGVDISPVGPIDQVGVLHICYPFQIDDFVGETARYIGLFKPSVTVINSTVAVGTTRAVAVRTDAVVVNSPVRGKHAHMLDELRSYTKFIGALDSEAAEITRHHFESLGLKTKTLSCPEATELAKLTETTYFGLIVAWAQEVERFCDCAGTHYDEVVSMFEEIKYLPPVKYVPGVIGGHCVMPNIEILNNYMQSTVLESIQASNQMKIEREVHRKGGAVVAPSQVRLEKMVV